MRRVVVTVILLSTIGTGAIMALAVYALLCAGECGRCYWR